MTRDEFIELTETDNQEAITALVEYLMEGHDPKSLLWSIHQREKIEWEPFSNYRASELIEKWDEITEVYERPNASPRETPQQVHLFRDERGDIYEWTMEDVIDAGTPVDPETGDDLEYLGPKE